MSSQYNHYNYDGYHKMVADAGYTLETHKNIRTDDGYMLTLHRIAPQPKNGNYPDVVLNQKAQCRHPVLLMPGMLGCSGHYLLHGKESLPYLLAEVGYDVWMANVRGATCSREHERLDHANDFAYWEFSLHEIGVHDVPAMIDYILMVTHSPKLHYVGYSQGCVVFFIMCSERPEYAQKVSLYAAMSPVILVGGAAHPWLPVISHFEPMLRFLTNRFGFGGRIRCGAFRRNHQAIASRSWIRFVIKAWLVNTSGGKLAKLCDERCKTMIMFMQGISFYSLFHAMQIHNTAKLVQFDNGPERNVQIYGSENTQEYKIENVTCPVAIYYSEQDWFLPADNVSLLAERLPNVIELRRVESDCFSHLDFIVSEEAIDKVYKPMVQLMLDLKLDEKVGSLN